MADKKEVIDYLRNQQKAVEIEAKVNGINSWVLVGAIALIAWHLIGTAMLPVWREYELLARVLVIVQAGYIAFRFCEVQDRQGDSIRFTPWRLKDMDTPYLDILQGLLLLGPVGFLAYFYGDYITLVIGIVGFVLVVSGCMAVWRLVRGDNPEGERLPEPTFGNSHRTNLLMTAISVLFLTSFLIHQALATIDLLPGTQIADLKVLTGVAALYILLILIIQRRSYLQSIRWTYSLETELLLDSIKPDVAIRRIEHRALGPRLQDVMDRFFDAIDQKFAELESLRDGCLEQLAKVASIPQEYSAERNARINSATEKCSAALDELQSECKELSNYLSRLKAKSVISNQPNIVTHIKGIEARQSLTNQKLKEWRDWLEGAKSDSAKAR